MATPSALEFAQWESEQRRAANAQRMVNFTQLRQEAQRQRQLDAEMMFKSQEAVKDRAAALERVTVAGKLDIEQEEARSKALLDRMDQQEKSKTFRKMEQSIGPRLPGETDDQYFTRGNKLLADQASTIFKNVDTYRKRAMTVAQKEAATRTARIAKMAMDTAMVSATPAEKAVVAKNPAAFQTVVANNKAVEQSYNDTIKRLEENTPPISAEGAIELQGLSDESKRWETVGSKLIGDPDFSGAMQYFVRSQPTVAREKLVRPSASATSEVGPTFGPPMLEGAGQATPAVAPPELSQPLQGLIPRTLREIGGVGYELNRNLIQPPLRSAGNALLRAYGYLVDPRVPSFEEAAPEQPPEFVYPIENPPRAFRSPYPPYIQPNAPYGPPLPPEFKF